MSIIKVDYGEVGGGGGVDAYYFVYKSPNYTLYKNGENVQSGQSTSYSDENIDWSMSAHTCTLKVKKETILYKGTGGSGLTVQTYQANSYIFNGQTNFYNIMPVFLQVV